MNTSLAVVWMMCGWRYRQRGGTFTQQPVHQEQALYKELDGFFAQL